MAHVFGKRDCDIVIVSGGNEKILAYAEGLRINKNYEHTTYRKLNAKTYKAAPLAESYEITLDALYFDETGTINPATIFDTLGKGFASFSVKIVDKQGDTPKITETYTGCRVMGVDRGDQDAILKSVRIFAENYS